MATKLNMFQGITNEIDEIDAKINNAVCIWGLNGKKEKVEVIGYFTDEAIKIRDEVSELLGKVKILIKGLDKNSPQLPRYNDVYNKCKLFLDSTEQPYNDRSE